MSGGTDIPSLGMHYQDLGKCYHFGEGQLTNLALYDMIMMIEKEGSDVDRCFHEIRCRTRRGGLGAISPRPFS